jgi:hypothetical protein
MNFHFWVYTGEKPGSQLGESPSDRAMTATAPEKLTALRTAVCAVCAGVLLYGIGDEAVFGSGWYRRFLDPNSLAGRIELTIAMARRATPSPVPEIAVVGNSVLAEGFSAKTGDAEANGRMRFSNLAGGAVFRRGRMDSAGRHDCRLTHHQCATGASGYSGFRLFVPGPAERYAVIRPASSVNTSISLQYSCFLDFQGTE